MEGGWGEGHKKYQKKTKLENRWNIPTIFQPQKSQEYSYHFLALSSFDTLFCFGLHNSSEKTIPTISYKSTNWKRDVVDKESIGREPFSNISMIYQLQKSYEYSNVFLT